MNSSNLINTGEIVWIVFPVIVSVISNENNLSKHFIIKWCLLRFSSFSIKGWECYNVKT